MPARRRIKQWGVWFLTGQGLTGQWPDNQGKSFPQATYSFPQGVDKGVDNFIM